MPRKKEIKAASKKTLEAFEQLNAEYEIALTQGAVDPALAGARIIAALNVLSESQVGGAEKGVSMSEFLAGMNIRRDPITVELAPKSADREAFLAAHGEALGNAAELHRQAADAVAETIFATAKAALALAATA